MEVKVKGGDVSPGRVPPDEIFAEGGGLARFQATAPADDAWLHRSGRTLVRAGKPRLRLRNNDRSLAVDCKRRCDSVFALCRGAAPDALSNVVAVRRALGLDMGIELGALGVMSRTWSADKTTQLNHSYS